MLSKHFPKRDFIERLKKVWESQPDLRFGQLIGNVFHSEDPYYVVDEKFIMRLEKYYFETILTHTWGPDTNPIPLGYGDPNPTDGHNYCICCGLAGQQYGSLDQAVGANLIYCTREVCVSCYERACYCAGTNLQRTAEEVHMGCSHDKNR